MINNQDDEINMTHQLYDLHSHTHYSDGKLSVEELLMRAVEFGVTDLAITDHDTVAAVEPAQRVISTRALPLNLITGIEISTAWQNRDIHIVGLNINIHHMGLVEFIKQQQQRRMTRIRAIAEKLEKRHILGIWEAVQTLAVEGNITRAHVAQCLVNKGVVTNITNAFKKYLGKGKIAYVTPQWCTIQQAINVIHQAGGVAVLAHPHRYDLSAKWLRMLLVEFKAAFGDAIEVSQSQQAPDVRRQLARYAQEYDFLASLGTDFHAPCAWAELGRGMWLPKGVKPVYLHQSFLSVS